MKKKKIWVLGIGAALLASLAALYVFNQATEAAVTTVRKGTIKKYVEDVGTVRYREVRDVSVGGSGLIQSVSADVGQQVKKGDLLLSLDKTGLENQLKVQNGKIEEIEATFRGRSDVKNYAGSVEKAKIAIRTAENACALAKDDYQYAKLLFEEGALSEKDLKAKETAVKNAEARAESAKIDLQQLEANTPAGARAVYKAQLEQAALGRESLLDSLRKQELRSPMDGVILEKKVERGAAAAPGTVAFVIGNSDHPEVEAYILADDAVEIEPGDEVELVGRSEERRTIGGKVTKLAPSAVEITSSLGVNQKRVKVTIEPSGPLTRMREGYEIDVRNRCGKEDRGADGAAERRVRRPGPKPRLRGPGRKNGLADGEKRHRGPGVGGDPGRPQRRGNGFDRAGSQRQGGRQDQTGLLPGVRAGAGHGFPDPRQPPLRLEGVLFRAGPRGHFRALNRSRYAGNPPRESARLTARTMALSTARAARMPATLRFVSTSPVAIEKIVSPSKVVCAGRTARAIPSCATEASLFASALDSRAFVATTPITVFSLKISVLSR